MKRSGFKRKAKKTSSKGKPILKKSSTVINLRNRAWKLMSEYIRKRGSHDGFNTCITCGVTLPISELHAGHFLHGKNKATYLLEQNVHPQCPKCNLYLNGNSIKYTLFMQKKYNQKNFLTLMDLHEKPYTWKKADLYAIIEEYKEKLKEVDSMEK